LYIFSVSEFVPPKAYCSSGYRGTEKGFLDTSKKGRTSKKGLTHTFVINKFRKEESLLSFSSNSYFRHFLEKRQIDERTLQITYFREQEDFDQMFQVTQSGDEGGDLLIECMEEYGLKSKKEVYLDSSQEVSYMYSHHIHYIHSMFMS